MSGPVPKRENERIRRNKPDIPTEIVPMIGDVIVPSLGIDDPHPMVEDFYQSLRDSGQAKYYEPSDWEYARFTMMFMDKLLKKASPSSIMLQTVNSMLGDLLVTEGQRRRVRMEVERGGETTTVYHAEDYFRDRFSKPA